MSKMTRDEKELIAKEREKFRKDLLKQCKKHEQRLKRLSREERLNLEQWFAKPLIREYSPPSKIYLDK